MVSSIFVTPELSSLLADYRLPDSLEFGRELAPVMYRADYGDGQWQDAAAVPFADIPVNPASTALQFAQQAFEGMKAYQIARSYPTLFRPNRNFNDSIDPHADYACQQCRHHFLPVRSAA